MLNSRRLSSLECAQFPNLIRLLFAENPSPVARAFYSFADVFDAVRQTNWSIKRLISVLSREDSIARPVQRTYFYRANLGYCLEERRRTSMATRTTDNTPSLLFPVSMLQSFFSRCIVWARQFAVICMSRFVGSMNF